MPNWCECDVTITGEPKAIKSFLMNQIEVHDYDGNPVKLRLYETENNITISSKSKYLGIKELRRAYSPINIKYKKNTNELYLFLLSAWDISAEELLNIAQKYNLDIEVFGDEGIECFHRNILIKNGKIEIDEDIDYDPSEQAIA